MDEQGDLGLRILGVLAGIGAALPIGFFALGFLQACPTCQVTVVLCGITLALIIATIAIADGHAWGALVVALYGAGMALVYALTTNGRPYATIGDAAFPALHAAIGVLALVVAHGLARRHGEPSGDGRRSGQPRPQRP